MTEREQPEQVLADVAEQANTLRIYGQGPAAGALELLVARLRAAMPEFLTWHDEAGAVLMSGKPRGWFRNRWPEWYRRGLAKGTPRKRQYLECVIPKPSDVSEALADAERTAREDAA